MLTSFWPIDSVRVQRMARLDYRIATAAFVIAATALCGVTGLHAQAPAPVPVAPVAPAAAATAAEKQALVLKWFGAASTLDFPGLVALSDKGAAEKFRLTMAKVPDLEKLRGTPDFKGLVKQVQDLLPQVLVVGEPKAEGDTEALVPVTLNEAKVLEWVELKELVNNYVDEVERAKRENNRMPASPADLAKRLKDSPAYSATMKQNAEKLAEQNRLYPKAWLVLEDGAWKINLTRIEKESREASSKK